MPIDDKAWAELEDRLWAAMVRDCEAPLDPLTVWQPRYVDLLCAVLTRGAPADWAGLSSLLREEQPLHPALLPVLADAIEARGRNKRDGRRRKLSPVEERMVARQVRYLRSKSHSYEAARADVAARFGLTDSVVKRAFEKHVPLHFRRTLRP
jgi:hypothetical protein